MGGDIGISSEHGLGADFWFTLKTKYSTAEIEYSAPQNWQGREVYLCEPHKTAALSLKHIFTHWLFNLTLSSSVEELIIQLNKIPLNLFQVGTNNHPLIIISSDGTNTKVAKIHQWLIKNPEFSGKILALLKSPSDENIQKLLDQGANQVLAKPVNRKALSICLEKIYPRRHLKNTGNIKRNINNIQNNLAVMVVDDNESNLKLVNVILNDLGIIPDLANDGIMAVSLSKQKRYDLILMDIQMPKLDGVESTAIIRAGDTNSQTPIIAVTAHAMKGEKEQLIKNGMDDYLAKPLNEADLIRVIYQWCPTKISPKKSKLKINNSAVTDSNQIKISGELINWPNCLQLANNKIDLAWDMLYAVIDTIPETKITLSKLLNEKNYGEFSHGIHKFHGALCYTGIPTLRTKIHFIETALKQSRFEEIDSLFAEILQCLQQVEEEFIALKSANNYLR